MASILLYLEWPFPCPNHENRSLEAPVYLFDYLHLTVQSLKDLLGETHEKMLHIIFLQQLITNFPALLLDAPSFPCWFEVALVPYIFTYTSILGSASQPLFCFFDLFFLSGARSAHCCGLVVHLLSMAV